MSAEDFLYDNHVKYLRNHLNCLPHHYSGQDQNRMTLLYFVVCGLDILGALNEVIPQNEQKDIIEWIYAQQVCATGTENLQNCGFRGGSFAGTCFQNNQNHIDKNDFGHLAMTYTALAVLRILGDDYSRVDKKGIIGALKHLQQDDGCFIATAGGSERDIRFLFCACATSCFLNDFSGINIDKAYQYIISSRGYDQAFSHGPYLESHGGSTYCAVSALALMDRLQDLPNKEELTEWLLKRQLSGFQGRPNKSVDTCYSFWVGASICNLHAVEYIDAEATIHFTLACQCKKGTAGGICKETNTYPDILHTFMALSGLSLVGFNKSQIAPIVPSLGITQRAAQGLVIPK
ncbi:geranylgeranyl transferase type-1 subunit beta [Acrasis kona]|uniref:Geranylgeranyl transferase type-1 subunit beta n=1 Tax=Acrasis kona TaxID=1008807 RepID=A0AAW2ZL76_9EUKA